MTIFTLKELEKIIESRSAANAEKSYTRSLLIAGSEKVARKFGEESLELVIAAIQGDKKNISSEAADVIYHLLVLLRASEVTLDNVLSELESRTRQSGFQEKANRK